MQHAAARRGGALRLRSACCITIVSVTVAGLTHAILVRPPAVALFYPVLPACWAWTPAPTHFAGADVYAMPDGCCSIRLSARLQLQHHWFDKNSELVERLEQKRHQSVLV
jgi:hypothetical protein